MQKGVEISRAVENKRIFVIDGDEMTRAAIQFMLQDENETHEIATVGEAIAKSGGRKADLVVLGAAIGREQGSGVFEEIARGIPGTKILLVAESADDAHACRQFGEAGVLAKPLTVKSVRQTVNTVLGRGPGFTPLRALP
jgi:DNA-binding response OmpR family regulator